MNYIKKNCYGIEVDGQYIDSSIKSYLNKLCIKELSTFDGRYNASKFILKKVTNLPFYVNAKVCFFPTESIRNYDVLLLNFHNILKVKLLCKNISIVYFIDGSFVFVKSTKTKLINQMKLSSKLLGY